MLLATLLATPALHAATVTWDGGGTTNNWSDGVNWVGDSAPVTGDNLIFPNGAARMATGLSDAAVVYGSVTFSGTTAGYTIGGTILMLTGGISSSATSGTNIISCTVSLGATQSFATTSNGDLTISGAVSLGAHVLTLNAANITTITLSSTVGGTGSLTLAGSGGKTLAGDNNFSGGVLHTGGTVRANTSNAFGSGTVTSNAGANSTVRFGNNVTITNPLVFNGGGQASFGFYHIDSGAATLSGPITIAVYTTGGGHFGASGASTLTVTGTVTSSVANLVTRLGTVEYHATSGYTTFQVGAGSPRIGTDNAIPTTASLDIGTSAAGSFSLKDFDQEVTGLARTGTTAGSLTTTGSSLLTISGSANFTYPDPITNGISLVRSGSGTQTLSGVSTYTGTTTITGGTLNVTGSLAAASAVTVAGGTLTGSGTVAGTVTMGAAGTVAPGTGGTTIATLSTGAWSCHASSVFSVDLNGTGPSADRVTSTGAIALDGTLTVASAINAAVGRTYTIASGTSCSGTFTGLTEGAYFAQSGRLLRINYTATSVTLTDMAPLFVWDGGGGNGNWSTPANWDRDIAPVAGADLQFGGTTNVTTANDFADSTSFASLTFLSGAGAFTLGGNRITLGGNITNQDDSLQTISLAMIMAATRTVDTGSADVAISGVLSGAGGLTKLGAGMLTLSGTNTHAGTTTVTLGTLRVNVSGNLSGAGPITLNGGTLMHVGELILSNAFAVTASSTIESDDGDDLILTGNSFTGTAGTVLSLTNTALTGTHALILEGTGYTYAGNLTMDAFSRIKFGNISGTQTFSGVIAGSVAANTIAVWRSAGGGTTVLSGANTYTGLTVVEGGTLTSGAAAVIPDAGTITVGTGATWNLNGFNETVGAISEPLVAPLTSGGTIALGSATLTTGGANSSTTCSGRIIGTGGLVKTGSGTLTFFGPVSNTYSGSTTVAAGGLALSKNESVTAIAGNLAITGGVVTFGNNHQIADTAAVSMSGAASVFNGTAINIGMRTGMVETFASLSVTGGVFHTAITSQWTVTGAVSFTGGTGNTAVLCNSSSSLSCGSLTLTAMTATAGATLGTPNSFTLYGNSSAAQTTLTVGSGGLVLNGSVLNMRRGAAGTLGSRLVLGGNLSTAGSAASAISEDVDGGVNGTLGIELSSTAAAVTRTLAIAVGGADLTISVPVRDGAATPGSLAKTGIGRLTLSGAGTYTGTTTSWLGALRVDADVITSTNGPLGNAASAIAVNGGTFESNTTTVSRPLTVSGGATLAAVGVARTIAAPVAVAGITASVFATSLRAATQDDWRATQAVSGTRVDTTIARGSNFGSGAERAAFGVSGSDADWNNFSAQWDGFLRVTTAGTTLSTRSDDGTRVWLDLDQDGVIDAGEWAQSTGWSIGQSPLNTALHAGLAVGVYRMRVQYEEGTGGNEVYLLWNDASQSAGGNNGLHIVPAALMGGVQLGNGGPDLTISGVISGAGSVLKPGAETVTLAGVNTYTGGTTVTAGTLLSAAAGVIPDTSPVVLRTGTAWNLGGFTETIGSLAGVGGVTLGAASLTAGGDNTSTTYTGIVSGSGAVVKTGSGLWAVGGASTYTGTTTLSAGTLRVDADVVTSTNGPLGNAASQVQLVGGIFASNTTTVSRPLAVSGAVTIEAHGATRTISAPITVATGVEPLIASFVASNLRGVTEDDWRIARTITGVRADSNIHLATDAFGTGAERAAFGIGGNDLNWDGFSIQWDGVLRVVTAGTTLYSWSDDGSRVWLDLDQDGVVDASEWAGNGWGTNHGVQTVALHAALPLGTYRMRIQYEEGDGGNRMALTWNDSANSAGTIDTRAVVPSAQLGGLAVGGAGLDLALTGVISGGGGVAKTGTSVVTVSAANTYGGSTPVVAGTLRVGANNTLPDTRVVVLSGATFDVGAFSDGIGSLSGLGAVTIDTGGLLSTGADGATTTFSGVVSGAGALTKAGAGTFTLGGANAFAGATTVSAGTLTVAHASGLGGTAAGTTVASGASLAIAGVAVGAEAVIASGTGVGGTGALTASGTASLAGTLTMTGDITVGGSGTLAIAGALSESGGARALAKVGSGTLLVAGANTYTGTTTVSAGTLLVNGNSVLATGAVSVASGATLGGTGTIGGVVTVASGGTISPGSASVAPVTIAAANTALTLAAGSSSAFTLGSVNDRIDLTGANSVITLGGTLVVSDGGGLVPGVYTLMTFTGGTSAGSFSAISLPTGATGVVTIDNTAGTVLLTLDMVNTGLTVAPGGTVVAMNTNLQASQAGSTTAQVVYDLTTAPAHGTLRRNLIALAQGEDFTQADIDANLISYEHGNLSNTSDSFQVTITGQSGAISAPTVAITVSGSGLSGGLLAYLPFEQTSGSSAPDAAGSYPGTIAGASAWAAGQIGNALTFDGTSTYVQLPSGMADFTSGMTIAVWARPTSSGSYARFVDFGNGPDNNNIFFTRASTTSELNLFSYNGATPSNTSDTGAITNNAWHHYAATITGPGSAYRYKNGSQLNSVAAVNPINNLVRTRNFIGGSNWAADALFQGQMDEVRIYNRVLTPGELKLLSQQTAPVFTNLQGDQQVYAGAGTTVALDVGGDATLGDADDLHLSSGWLRVTNSNPFATSALTVATTAEITTSGTTISHNGNAIGTVDAVRTGAAGADLEIDFTTRFATPTAIRDLVRALRYSDTTPAQRTFSLTLCDGIITPVPTTVSMTASSALSLSANTGLNIAAGGVGTFSTASLAATSTVGQSAAQITYTVQATPASGVLRKSLVALAVAGTFTQADVDGGLISYEHGALATLNDSFQVALSDAALNSGGQALVVITASGLGLGSGLAGYWPLDDASGATALDRSGNRNHTTLVNTPTWAASHIGGFLTFNGTNQYGSFSRPVQDDFTIVSWFKSSDTGDGNSGSGWPAGSGLVTAEAAGVLNDFGMSYAGTGYVLAGTGNPDTTVVRGGTANDNIWHQAAFTRQRSSGSMALRLDNGATATKAGATTALSAQTNMNLARQPTGINYFDGSLDDVRLYDRVLTAEELTALYQVTSDAAPALTNLNGDSVLVSAGSTAFAIDTGANATVSDSDDLIFSGGYLLVEDATGGTSGTLSIDTVGLITTAGAIVSYNGNAIGTIDATLTGAAGASLKVLLTTSAADATAVTALVRALRFTDAAAAPVDHTLRVTVSDGLRTTTATTTAFCRLILAANTGVTVASARVVTVESTAFSATQGSATSAQVVYTMTVAPTHGLLRLNRVELGAGGTFTQADINNYLVSYEHGDLGDLSDTLQVTIAGLNGATIGATSVAITVAGTGLAANLQARWRMDEGSGTVVGDAAGTNTGTALNTTWIDGRLNGGLDFAGNAEVNAGNAAVLRPATAITVSAWFRSTSTDFASILRHDGHFTALQLTGTGNAQVGYWQGGVLRLFVFPWSWNDGAWHHYTATYDSVDSLRVFIDGTHNAANATFTGPLTTTTSAPFMLGSTEGGGERYTGSLDEVRVYDRVLSRGEIRLLAEQAVPVLSGLHGDAPAATEDGAAVALDTGAAASVSDSDDVVFAGGRLLVDNVTASGGGTISVATVGLITTSGATVSYNGNAIGSIDGTLTGAAGADLRIDFTTDAATATAVSALIQALRYQDTLGPAGARVLGVTLSDGVFTSATATVTVAVTAVNDAPVVVANTGVTVASGRSVTVTPTQLLVSDQDHTAAQLTYTLTAIPAHGHLRRALVALGVNDTFTQDDVDQFLISYEHGTLSEVSDGFTFTLSDGAGGTLGATPVAITVAGSGLTAGLVAWWKFDETSGTNASDSSGNGHAGTHVNGPQPVTGRLNGALAMTRAAQQRVTVPYHANFALATFTVSALVRPGAATAEYGILGTRTGADHTFDVKWEDDRIHGDLGDGTTWLSTAVDVSTAQGGALTPGTWYLVTYVIDNATQSARLFVDGTLRATVGFTGVPLLMRPDQTMTIGNSGTYPPVDEHAEGAFDDVRIYSRALTSGEVRTLYQQAMPVIAGLGGDTPTHVENAGAVALDTGADAALADPDDLTFAGGALMVENSNGAVDDLLSVAHIGTGAGQIGVSGATISYGGADFASIDAVDSGAAGADLRITFTTRTASPAAVGALLRALRFANPSETPLATARTLLVTVSDNTYASATATVTMGISSVPDLLARLTLDADGDGHLDTIRITTDQALDDDFSAMTVDVAGYTTGTPVTGDLGNDAIFEVPLNEVVAGDTGGTPAVRITANTSLHGQASTTLVPVEGAGTAAVDGAAPVLLTVAWSEGGAGGVSAGDTVALTFSESVTVAGMVPADLGLPVAGDTLDTTTIADQVGAIVSMTLAGAPRLSPGGVYDSSTLVSGRPSGLFVADPLVVTDAVGLHPATGNAADARDVSGSDLLAIAWVSGGTAAKTWALGPRALGSIAYTTTSGLDLALRNVGDTTADLEIAVTASAPSGWLPAAAAGSDAFLLKADNAGLPAGDPSDPAAYELILGTTDQGLATALRSGLSSDLELYLRLPTAITSGGGVQQTTTVTITATLPP